ncbi:l-arabinokinase [Phtheirospermum japonicum]|uniref:L-arabinokinase n=1 Tax=Phtheirospermum japonicum TaxID=374723 RepID=A0A830B8G4_9LAMI|nr:l-arabinokinase [Phtheirospermum japonicum]
MGKKPLVFAYYVTGHGFGHATRVLEVLLDCGAVQADALTVDRFATLEKIAVVPRDSILATEVEWLKSIDANLVVSDAVPVACRAAADAEISAVCVTNFRVYDGGRTSQSLYYLAVPAFRDAVDVPLVVRRLHKSRAEVRKELGIEESTKVLIYNFGGQLAGWKLQKEYLPDGWICLVCGASEGQELPENFMKLPKDVYTPDIIAASDCMLGNIYFQCGVEIIRRDLLTGRWAPYIERAITLRPCYEAAINGGEVVACILEDTALGKHPTPSKLSGSRRLRDAIVLGYQLHRVSGKDIDVPEWYTTAQTELSSRTPLPDENNIESSSLEEIIVARAPGRLDVMGGIADYSGSLVLQGGNPISYEKARQWAAYVAGTILVLMTELGIRFVDGISILVRVSSGVPEGKGVSSSAAIEVATMSAVENHIVGAPCGVMDQMASACGETNKLLAMLCQPAEVLGHVEIPSHIRFWGIDSGIRHSVGGADYGSVRIGTFMGRKMIKSMASKKVEVTTNDETDENGMNLLQTEAALDYLCNLSPHRYEESYVHRLPEFVLGNEFIEDYEQHDDAITIIDKKCSYAAFKALLSAALSDDQLSALGELMYQCHYSYNACGLGSDGTDKLVELVQEMQHSISSKSFGGTLFGAKITGGGSGGTICVVGKNLLKSSEQILKIQHKYKATTGFLPYVFEGSSPGAGKFGYLKIRLRSRST